MPTPDDDLDEDLDEYDDDDDLDDVDDEDPSTMSPARRATLVAVPAAIIAGLIAFFVVRANLPETTDESAAPEPVTGLSITEVDGTADACANLVEGLPASFDDRTQRAVTGHPGALAWGDPPVVLVCGVDAPTGIEPTANLNVVNGVTWYAEEDVDTSAYGLPGTNTVWTAIDREAYVAVAMPADFSSSVAISPISTVIADRLGSIEGG